MREPNITIIAPDAKKDTDDITTQTTPEIIFELRISCVLSGSVNVRYPSSE